MCVQKMLNHGLNHGLFLSLFKLIPCPIHWIVYALAYSNFMYLNSKAVSAMPKKACSAQTHKSISFTWIVCSTIYVYLWNIPILGIVYQFWWSYVSNNTNTKRARCKLTHTALPVQCSRKLWKSRGGGINSNLAGIICPPPPLWWDMVN